VANRRDEERERLRQARQERESSQAKSEKRRLFAVYAAAGVIGLLVVVGIVAAIASSGGSGGGGASHINQASGSTNGFKPDDREGTPPPKAKAKPVSLKQAAKQANCVLRLHLKDEGHEHIAPTAPTPDYKTNPPTSGNHATAPYQEADGAYSEMPGEIFIVHSLEHGRMEIQYSSELPEEDQLELKGLYDTMYGGTLLFPNDNMDYAVAATTWTNLMGCRKYKGEATLNAIRAFGKATWGRYGGEPANAFSLKGPTPLEPQ
jgi:hypothetical protein